MPYSMDTRLSVFHPKPRPIRGCQHILRCPNCPRRSRRLCILFPLDESRWLVLKFGVVENMRSTICHFIDIKPTSPRVATRVLHQIETPLFILWINWNGNDTLELSPVLSDEICTILPALPQRHLILAHDVSSSISISVGSSRSCNANDAVKLGRRFQILYVERFELRHFCYSHGAVACGGSTSTSSPPA